MSVVTARPRVYRAVLAFLVATGLAVGSASGVYAQGVTTGAVRGTVTDQQGQPVVGATIQMVNSANGQRFQTVTAAAGRFFLANVVVGSYVVEARSIGYRPIRRDLQVTLGQVASLTLQLEQSTVELTAITVPGNADNALLSSARTGPTTFVSENLIRNLPSLARSFTDFTKTNSLVNGTSIAGQNDRFNSLQIDGGTNSDLFALAASNGTPGGRNGSRPLSIEAVQEFQVLVAPFDVRQGGFTGGLVNAVTKSGTNQFRGSAFYYMQNEALVGRDSVNLRASDFNLAFYGFSLGGPIIRDRLHFFVSTEWRERESPFGGITIGTDTTGGRDSVGIGVRLATAERVRQYTTTALGFDPGGYGRPTIPNPDANIFAKLSAQVGARGQAELSYNRVRSSVSVLTHDPSGANPTRLREGYQYDASGYDNASMTNSVRARLNTPLSNRLTNELIASYNFFKDEREMGNRRPVLIVGADRHPAGVCTPLTVPAVTTGCPTTFFGIGGERFSHANLLEQKTLEIADNLTMDLGSHVLTFGGRAERFQFLNVFFPASLGAWFFADTTAYFNNQPSRYEIALPGVYIDSINGRTDGPIADFTFSQYALYAQDQWRPTARLTLTLGTRFDFTRLPQPAYNPMVDTVLSVRTDNAPTTATLISPRFGFNYDVRGDASTIFRGGAGVFSGRTPYVWASNAYTNTGLEQVQLTCTNVTGLPTFTADPANQPRTCPTGGLAAATPAVVFFDKNFKLPQNMRFSLGMDHRLPWGMVGTFDAMYTKSLNNFILEDVNLQAGGVSVGEGNRVLYGTLSGTSSTATPRRVTARVRDALRQFNSNRDYSWSMTFQLNKRWSNNVEFAATYTYSRSMDIFSGTSDISNSNLSFASLDGTFAHRNLTRSYFDQPHAIRLSGTTSLPYGVRFSLFYTGTSGRPYAWRYGSDVNADGFSGNDLVYVPLNASDISLNTPSQWTQLDAFINSEKCLREQRGRVMERNSCRNPWVSFVDARATKAFNTVRGQQVELVASLFNVLSFLGVGGNVYEVTGFENVAMLNLARYNAALGRGVYNLALPAELRRQNTNASRWKLELGARYTW